MCDSPPMFTPSLIFESSSMNSLSASGKAARALVSREQYEEAVRLTETLALLARIATYASDVHEEDGLTIAHLDEGGTTA